MSLSGFIYYYRDLLAYNAMWYYTYLVETIKPYYFSNEEIVDKKMNFNYLDYKNNNYVSNSQECSNKNGFCVIKINGTRELYAPIALNDITKDYLKYRTTGENETINKIMNSKSEILTVSVTISSNNETLSPFDCSNLFHKFYFPGNKLVLTPDTAEQMIKLIEYEYDTKFMVDYNNCKIKYVIITMSSQFYMSSNMLLSISPEGYLDVVNREEE